MNIFTMRLREIERLASGERSSYHVFFGSSANFPPGIRFFNCVFFELTEFSILEAESAFVALSIVHIITVNS